MICVYDGRDAERAGHGLGVIHPSECVITEETGGSYELTATLPLCGEWLLVQRGNVIRAPGAPHRISGQVQDFRIYGAELADDGRSVRVQARHVFYDGKNSFVLRPVEFDDTGITDTLDEMIGASDGAPYTLDVQTDDATYTGSIDLVNWVNALLDPDAGIVALARLRLERDGMTVHLRPDGGEESGMTLRWGSNMAGLTRSKTDDQVVTRLQPAGEDADGNPVYLPETHIDSPRIDEYWQPLRSVWRVSGAKVGQKTRDADGNTVELTLEDVHEMLREAARERLQSGCDLPNEKTSLAYVDMNRIGARDAAWAAVHVCLYDWLTIVHGAAHIQERVQVTGYSWDVLRQMYTRLEVGDAFRDRTDTVIVTAPQLRKETAAARKRSLRVQDLIDIEADKIREQAREIELIAYDFKDLDSRTSEAMIRLDGLDGQITMLGTDVEDQGNVINQVQLDLNAAENEILAKVGRIEFDELSGDVNSLETNVIISTDGLREIIQKNNKIVADLKSTIDGLEHWVTDADGNVSELTNTVRGLENKVTTAGDKASVLTNTADGLTNTILGQAGDLSQLMTRADEIRAGVRDANGNMGALITKSDSVTAKVKGVEGKITTLAVTADGLTNTVMGQGGQLSEFKARIDEISLTVTDTNGNMGSLITKSDSVTAKVKGVEGQVSQLAVTADGLNYTLTKQGQELSALRALIDEISLTVKDTQGAMGQLIVKSDSITGKVVSADEKMSSKFEMLAGIINLETQADGTVVSVRLDAAEDSIRLKADKTYVEKLIADEIKATNAQISNITSGLTVASVLSANMVNGTQGRFTYLRGDAINLGDNNLVCYTMEFAGRSGKYFGTGGGLNLAHSHAVIVNDDGTITLGEVSAEGGNFKIADTKAYKDGVSAAYGNGYNVGFDAGKDAYLPTAINRTGYSTADKTVTVRALNSHQDLLTGQVIDAVEIYNAGWNECRAAMTRINNLYTISQNAPGTLYMLVNGSYTSVGSDWVKVTSYNSAYRRPAEIA